jgi:hypothetical protein
MFDLKTVRSPEHRLAWLVAIAADANQIGALPLFAAGGLSPAGALLDLGVAAILIRLLGWHRRVETKSHRYLQDGFRPTNRWASRVFFQTMRWSASRRQLGLDESISLTTGRP